MACAWPLLAMWMRRQAVMWPIARGLRSRRDSSICTAIWICRYSKIARKKSGRALPAKWWGTAGSRRFLAVRIRMSCRISRRGFWGGAMAGDGRLPPIICARWRSRVQRCTCFRWWGTVVCVLRWRARRSGVYRARNWIVCPACSKIRWPLVVADFPRD